MIQWERNHKEVFCAALSMRGFHIQWHEDRFENDIPDVSFGFGGVDGWMEFKFVDRAPRMFSLPKFTGGQQSWLIERGTKGKGATFLVIGMANGRTIIYHWREVRDLYGKASWEEAASRSIVSENSANKAASRLMRFLLGNEDLRNG